MFTLSLSELLKNAYKIDLDNYFDYSNFYFEPLEIPDSELLKSSLRKEFPDLTDEAFCEIARLAAQYRYEDSYMEEYYNAAKKAIEKKIYEDFMNLNTFFDEEDEISYPGTLDIEKIDWKRDVIVFDGPIEKLASYIINAINGYGMFYYESIDDFFDSMPAYSFDEKLNAITSHLHWLHEMENIYGTIYNFFIINLENLDSYGTFGDYDFTIDDFNNAMDSLRNAL